jgi:hypothetical protein
MKKSITLLMIAASAILKSQTAQLQVIHNSADAATAVIDVYAGTTLLIDDFAFRNATPFIPVPAGVDIRLGFAPSTSTSVNDTLFGLTVNFNANASYIAIADGIVSPTGYAPAQPFTLSAYALAQTTAQNSANTDVLVHHGSTDAPTVDVVAPFVATLVNDLAYGSYSNGYLQLPTADYNVQIRNSAGTDVVAEYQAPLQTLSLQGAAITVVASGFLNPANNSNGPAFGLYVALPAGGPLVALPSVAITSTRLQAIHNCADAAAATVDVYLNNQLLINDFAFRTASSFIDAPAGVPFRLVICPPNSTDTTNKIIGFTYNLSNASKYVLVADGIVSGTGYSPAPAFAINVYASAKETSTGASNTDVLVHHGSTDAPVVDVTETTAGLLVNDIAYGAFDGYLQLPTADYQLNITDASGTTTVVSYDAPLQTLNLQGAAITVVASGFLAPALNSNGPAFGLWVALASGGNLIPLPVSQSTGLNEVESSSAFFTYPNPSENFISIGKKFSANASVEIYSYNGAKLYSGLNDNSGIVNTESFPTGIYFIQVSDSGKKYSAKFLKQ